MSGSDERGSAHCHPERSEGPGGKGLRATRAPRSLATLGMTERPVVLVSAAMFLLSGGENLWRKFLPKYLQALGAPIRAVGFYGSIEDFLDGIYQYPGGFLGDHLGRRKALLLFVALAMAGYAIYAAAPSWMWAIVALVFAMAWSSMAARRSSPSSATPCRKSVAPSASRCKPCCGACRSWSRRSPAAC